MTASLVIRRQTRGEPGICELVDEPGVKLRRRYVFPEDAREPVRIVIERAYQIIRKYWICTRRVRLEEGIEEHGYYMILIDWIWSEHKPTKREVGRRFAAYLDIIQLPAHEIG